MLLMLSSLRIKVQYHVQRPMNGRVLQRRVKHDV